MTLKELMIEAVGEVGGNMGDLAGALRERMYAANAAEEFEIAKAANALYQEYTYYAMQLGRLEIAAIDESVEMKTAIAEMQGLNRNLKNEQTRVMDITKKINNAAALATRLGKAIGKIDKLLG